DRLPADAAAEVLDSVAPRLAPSVRTRLLAEAAGLPLALMELPAAAADLDGLDPVLPLTERLERTFTARVSALPAATRTALLVAALNETTSLAETLAATAMLLADDGAVASAGGAPGRAGEVAAGSGSGEAAGSPGAGAGQGAAGSQAPVSSPVTSADPEILAPAVEARLVELTSGVLTFRHPLMRSAI
ncbi:hypothetical protein GTY80_35475, partial [Amycolatopsis sp. SID8362]|nr:hypothetical protein [Amycolatopsis sp. SID8362]NED45219.1 hypothetical protein [Amycolatopsis sp. SID8362]